MKNGTDEEPYCKGDRGMRGMPVQPDRFAKAVAATPWFHEGPGQWRIAVNRLCVMVGDQNRARFFFYPADGAFVEAPVRLPAQGVTDGEGEGPLAEFAAAFRQQLCACLPGWQISPLTAVLPGCWVCTVGAADRNRQ